jgi:hypothetical protein
MWFTLTLVGFILVGLASGSIRITGDTDLAGVAAGSGWIAAIFGSIFGVALGNGSRESARVIWTLPTERWKLALQIVIVDLMGTTAAFACGYAVMLLASTLAGVHLTARMLQTVSAGGVVMALTMAYAAYGWSALAGMLGRRVAYCGIVALPALMIWMILAQSWVALRPILRAPIVANPFVVFNAGLALNTWQHHHFALDPVTLSLQWLGTTWETPIFITIAFVTCAGAIALWQRAEAISA